MSKLRYLAGQRYGSYLILSVEYQAGKHKRTICECLCDCGNVRNIEATNLGRGAKSCEICRLKRVRADLLGKKFGKYLVLDIKYKQGKHKKTMCECVCDCGNIRTVIANSLMRGKSKSCGCRKSEEMDKFKKWCGEMSGSYFTRIKSSAIKRCIEFQVSKEYMWELFLKQNRKCALSGEELIFAKNERDKTIQTASIDRIDSAKGYIEGNLQWVHKNINVMKMAMPENVFIEWCGKIFHYCQLAVKSGGYNTVNILGNEGVN